MGMGEPLANYANVMAGHPHPARSRVLQHRRSARSPSPPSACRRRCASWRSEELPINLAISLHAPNEPLRKQLIPWAEHFALDEILDAARYYFDRDRPGDHAGIHPARRRERPARARPPAREALQDAAREREPDPLQRSGGRCRSAGPKADDVVRSRRSCGKAGVNAHVRKSRGRDIDAACGQLRRKNEAVVGVPVTIGVPS